MGAAESAVPVARAGGGWWLRAGLAVLRVLTGVIVAVGMLAAVRGVVWDLFFAAEARGNSVSVPVDVRLHDLDRLRVLQATGPGSRTVVPFRLQQGTEQPGLQIYAAGVSPENWIDPGTGPFVLKSVGATVAEQSASRGGAAVVGVCMAWGALLVRKLVLSIGRGQPFERRNAARLTGIAGLIVAATLAAGALPYLAARMVLSRLGLAGPGSPLYVHLAVSAAPLWLAVFLLVLAAAFRRGAELARDAEGLV